MREKVFLMLVLIMSSAHSAIGQNKVVFEGIRYATAVNYLEDKSNQKPVLQYLDAALQKSFGMQLSETDTITLGNTYSLQERLAAKSHSNDTSCRHLLMAIEEYDPSRFFLSFMIDADSVLRKETKTVLRISAYIFRHDDTVTFSNAMDIFVGHAKGPGIGFLSQKPKIHPKSFPEILKIAFSNLFDTENGMGQLALKVQPVYAMDNYITPRLQGVARITADTIKNISAYRYAGVRQMLRQGQPFYEEMIMKGKKAQPYPAEIRNAVSEVKNAAISDFVCLQQEGRDVLYNKDYLLKIYTQIDPETPTYPQELMFTNFIPGQIHTMLDDKDTVAKFSIRRFINEPEKKIYADKIYNGVDTATMFTVSSQAPHYSYLLSYIVKGTLGGKDFEIKCSGIKSVIKELYYNGKLVCIAQGIFRPEVFAVFDASLSAETLNQLFIIGFNRFFE